MPQNPLDHFKTSFFFAGREEKALLRLCQLIVSSAFGGTFILWIQYLREARVVRSLYRLESVRECIRRVVLFSSRIFSGDHSLKMLASWWNSWRGGEDAFNLARVSATTFMASMVLSFSMDMR